MGNRKVDKARSSSYHGLLLAIGNQPLATRFLSRINRSVNGCMHKSRGSGTRRGFVPSIEPRTVNKTHPEANRNERSREADIDEPGVFFYGAISQRRPSLKQYLPTVFPKRQDKSF
ncbi:hypothetical protein HC256_007979 [Beauveria bassiana]|nr:hypothetical protein HC256_007979 [Beauveria bassiana]